MASPNNRDGSPVHLTTLSSFVQSIQLSRLSFGKKQAHSISMGNRQASGRHVLVATALFLPLLMVACDPGVTVAVTAVELSTKQKTYRASYPRPQDFPIEVLSGQTQSLTVTAW
jgi:hypothetical protein